MSQVIPRDEAHMYHALAGAGGGILSMLITYPLLNLSTRAQVDRRVVSASPALQHKDEKLERSISKLARHLVSRDGLLHLYQGLNSALVGIGVTNFVYYYWYEWAKSFLQHANFKNRRVNRQFQAWKLMLPGAWAGAATVLITNPIWVLNTRMSTIEKPVLQTIPGEEAKKRQGLFATLLQIVRTEGFAALFAGIVPALILVMNPVLQYSIAERLRLVLESKRALKPTDFFFLGGIGKLFATLLTYPYITLKSRMHVASKESRDSGLLRLTSRILKDEGWQSLYKGIGPKISQSVVTAALLFGLKDVLFQSMARARMHGIKRRL